MAQIGQSIYIGVAGTQLALVMLASPAATAGAICLDRARGTLKHLLMTDLSNVEIVLGKLGSRLIPVLSLLACTMPLLALLTLAGGVDPQILWRGFVVSVGMAVLGCSLAFVLSLWVAKTHEALLLTYAIWLLWLLAGPMLRTLSWSVGLALNPPPRTAEPFFLVLAPCWYPRSTQASDYLWFLAVTCAISALLIGLAIARIRVVCTRETVRKPSHALAVARNQSLWKLLSRTIPWVSPSLDQNPVLWRECNRSRPSLWASTVIALYFLLALSFSIVAVCFGGGWIAFVVNAFQLSIGLLILSITAATSLAEERAHGSLDLLLSTSLSTREIVLGKWCGVYRVVPLLAIFPTFVVGAIAYERGAGIWWAPTMCVYVLCAGAAVTSLGLALATRLPRVGHAVSATVSLYVVFTLGWCFVVFAMYRSREGPAMLSPLMWAARFTYEVDETRPVEHQTGWAILAAVVAAWFAFELLMSTLANFESRLGRIPDASARIMRPSTTMRVLIAIYLLLAASLAFSTDRSYQFPIAVTFQFAVATFITVTNAAASPKGAWVDAGAGRGAIIEDSAGRAIVVKWLAALRLLLPGMILAWLMIAVWFEPVVGTYQSLWREIPIMVAYMVSAGAAAASLGVAFRASATSAGPAALVAIAVWSLVNAGYLIFEWALPGGYLWRGLCMSSPSLGLWTLAKVVTRTAAPGFDAMSWAIFWSGLYSLSAVGLLFAARAIHRRKGHP